MNRQMLRTVLKDSWGVPLPFFFLIIKQNVRGAFVMSFDKIVSPTQSLTLT